MHCKWNNNPNIRMTSPVLLKSGLNGSITDAKSLGLLWKGIQFSLPHILWIDMCILDSYGKNLLITTNNHIKYTLKTVMIIIVVTELKGKIQHVFCRMIVDIVLGIRW